MAASKPNSSMGAAVTWATSDPTIATVDADGITGVRTVDFSGSEGGVDTSGIGKGIASPLAGAMAKVTGMIKKENLATFVSDVSGMERGYNEVKIKKLS